MAIPEAQLETWSHQGSITQSAATYKSIKAALENPDAHFENRDFKVFLQGSYGNDTNIYAESDVDVVICYEGGFYHDANKLPAPQFEAFTAAHPGVHHYSYDSFKEHVRTALKTAFGTAVQAGGNKAIKIIANGTRRNADVVVAYQFRRYHKFNGTCDESHETGICFFTADGTRVANYPKQHSENCTAKHGATASNFKRAVRIFKNMRSKLVEDGQLKAGEAPSYYIEGLLYNVPSSEFTGNLQVMVRKILVWLYTNTERTNFVCANGQYYLLRDGFHECWPVANGNKFISEVVNLWDNWS